MEVEAWQPATDLIPSRLGSREFKVYESSTERQGRCRRGALTSPSSIHDFPFGAGLLVLQVIVQEHFPQQVALPRQINVTNLPKPGSALEWNGAEHLWAAAGRALPAWEAGAAQTRSRAEDMLWDHGAHPLAIFVPLHQHLLQCPQHLDAQLLLRFHEVLGVLHQPGTAEPPSHNREGQGGPSRLQAHTKMHNPQRMKVTSPSQNSQQSLGNCKASSLGQETSALTSLKCLRPLHEKQLWPVEDIH